MVTDYDCWQRTRRREREAVVGPHEGERGAAKRIVARAIAEVPAEPDWPEHRALDGGDHDAAGILAGGAHRGAAPDPGEVAGLTGAWRGAAAGYGDSERTIR